MDENILEMHAISKSFPGVKALDNVSFKVKKGEIHSLVGENGAGKSTLIKILCGVYPHGTYEGEIVFEGRERIFHNIDSCEQSGIVCIHQELHLCPDLSIAENIYLNQKPGKFGIVNYDAMYQKSLSLMEEIGLNSPESINYTPDVLVKNLGMGQKQLVEIAKALSRKVKLLILDEPTSSLTQKESEKLHNILHELKNNGITCIYISHKLDDVLQISDSISVLRDGHFIGTFVAQEISKENLVQLMVGRELTKQYPVSNHVRKNLVMRIENYSVPHPDLPDTDLLENINLNIYAGEILGISGLVGAGRTELVSSIFGAFLTQARGKIIIDGEEVNIKSPSDAISNGIFLLTEDRKALSLNLLMSVKENLTLACLDDFSVGPLGILNQHHEMTEAKNIVDRIGIKAPSIETMARNLSGGNQQKIVIGKALLSRAKIIIFDEPTRGIDVGAKYEIYKIMHDLVQQDVAIIMISSELEEIIGISDRVVTMCQGRISGEFFKPDLNQEEIMYACVGGDVHVRKN